jgi:hypothetical protein
MQMQPRIAFVAHIGTTNTRFAPIDPERGGSRLADTHSNGDRTIW